VNLERHVTDWLRTEAPPRAAERLLETTLARVATTPQPRVGWWRPSALDRSSRSSRPLLALAAGLLGLGLLGGVSLVGGLLTTESPAPTVPPVPTTDGWIVFTTNANHPGLDSDVYLIRDGGPAVRIVGSDTEALDERCPAFSPDGTRLAYGQALGSDDRGHADAAVMIADLDGAGEVTTSNEIRLGDSRRDAAPPCAVWSPDGRRVAFAVVDTAPWPDGCPDVEPATGCGLTTTTREVLVVLVEGGQIEASLPAEATDLEWSPDGSRLAVATRDLVEIYSVGTWEQLETLPASVGARFISWSPDARFIAYERDIQVGEAESADLVVHDLDTGSRHVEATGYEVNHGFGPAWSPNGDQIVYQRLCAATPDGGPCREQHDVVILASGVGSDWRPSEVTARVMPQSYEVNGEGTFLWPFWVTWSPNADSLLYSTFDGPQLVIVPTSPVLAPMPLPAPGTMTAFEIGVWVPTQTWIRPGD
jgi:dipeptidyl aminopeptidase/acylaminoacyl peptidase